MRFVVLRLTHLGICVSDLDRSAAFYRDALGFRELGRLEVASRAASVLLELEGVDLEAVYLERDGFRIELLRFRRPGTTGDPAPRPMNALGFTHLSFRVADLDAALAAVRAAGGRVLEATRTEAPEFGARAAFAADPDGVRLEIVEAPGDPAALPGDGRPKGPPRPGA